MTIALGFKCVDGIVLCTDTEISKGSDLKFKGPKLFKVSPQAQWVGAEWVVITAYAGYENIATRVQQLISGEIQNFTKSPDLIEKVVAAIEHVLSQEYKKHKASVDNLQMLFAISARGEEPKFLRSSAKVVSEANVEYAGWGDSSVIRFLADLLCPYPQFMNTKLATMVAIYMVSKAKKYVGSCGQETHAVIVRDGVAQPFNEIAVGYREKYLDKIEEGIAHVMRSLLNVSLSKNERDIAIGRFSEDMNKLGTFSDIRF